MISLGCVAFAIIFFSVYMLTQETPSSNPIPTQEPTPTPTPEPTQEPVIVIPSATVEIIKDIEYGRAGDIPLLLIFYWETMMNWPKKIEKTFRKYIMNKHRDICPVRRILF
jgi:hypothetical protein